MAEQRLSLAIAPNYGSSAAISVPGAQSEETRRGWVFPLEPFWLVGYATPSLYEFVPTHLRLIQSLPHLVLLIGTATNERRDFQRFLRNIAPKLTTQRDSGLFLDQFRRFLSVWLQILAECSAEPVSQPYTVMGEVEFNSFKTAHELAEGLSEQVKVREICFVRDRVDEGKKGVLFIRTTWTKMVQLQRKALKWTGLSRFVKTRPDEEQGVSPKEEVNYELPACVGSASSESYWFKFALGAGCGLDWSEDCKDSCPLRIRCVLFICIILSPEHLAFMLSFFIGLGLLLINIFALSDPSQVAIASLAVTLCCLTFVLYDFLDIDTLQRLEEQILEMQVATQQVDARRKQLQAFFARMQLLFSLWQMRTLPRLGLMKQFGMAVEDVEESGLLPLLVDMVTHLDSLEGALLPLHMWQEEGKLSQSDKREVLDLLQSLGAQCSVKDTLERMPTVVAGLRERMQRVLAATEE